MAQAHSAQANRDLRELRQVADRRRTSAAAYAVWGSLAVCAVFGAALAIALVVSANRSKTSFFASKPPAPSATAERPTEKTAVEHAIGRMQDALRALAAERDRLVIRVDQLERLVGDITASIDRQKSAQTSSPGVRVEPSVTEAAGPPPPSIRTDTKQDSRAELPPDPKPTASLSPARLPIEPSAKLPLPLAPPQTKAAAPPTPATKSAVAPPTESAAPADSAATRTDFAIDLGAEGSIDGLRALWAAIRGNHGAILEGTRPLVSIRDGSRTGTVELRLIAGPFANAGAAARACAALQAKGLPCKTAVFDGQRLALR